MIFIFKLFYTGNQELEKPTTLSLLYVFTSLSLVSVSTCMSLRLYLYVPFSILSLRLCIRPVTRQKLRETHAVNNMGTISTVPFFFFFCFCGTVLSQWHFWDRSEVGSKLQVNNKSLSPFYNRINNVIIRKI